ncbi:MAG: AAA family ATPase [Muribaculaceae bacterium]|nr:AAA family ATPase [Muribaculaceae bacterium]
MEKKESIESNVCLSRQTDPAGVIAFLESGFIPGVGKVIAQKIYNTLGSDLLNIEELGVEDLLKVPGIGEKLANAIIEAVKTLPQTSSLLTFLFSCGLAFQDIRKIIARYGSHTEKVVTENPYDMVEDVWKFSFFRADRIGRKLGITGDDYRRLRGALLTSVKLHAERGSLFATREELIATASRISGVEENKFPKEIDALISEERLVEDLGGIYLPVYHKAEKETAAKLASIIADTSNKLDVKFQPPEQDLEGHYFTEEQKRAILTVRDNPVSIITGDPGTGKTTTVRGLIRLFEDEGKKVILTAPTGRSTKKLEMMAGASAKTIHRLLGFNRGKGYFNKRFDADVLIIDEASLLEQVLFNHLLQALPPKIKVVLVGDVGQLPPIGAGKVLEDMMDSGVVPVARLTRNFRQEQGSCLAENIGKIKEGAVPEQMEENDFAFIVETDPLLTREKLLELVTQKLPEQFGVEAADVQVVSPQLDGLLGTRELNNALQDILQKDSPEISRGTKRFRLGDRVVQSENSSRRGVFNGETGKIIDLNPEAVSLTVAFNDGKKSTYTSKDLSELSLAYATSVHKLQGTETDYLVMPLTTDHENMLYRNLLFTAVSRARKYCALVGDPAALRRAVENPVPYIRNSNLKQRLQMNLREQE